MTKRDELIAELRAIEDRDEAELAADQLVQSNDSDRIALAIDIALERIPVDPGVREAAGCGVIEGHDRTLDLLLAEWERRPVGRPGFVLPGLLGEIAFKMRPDPDPRLAEAALRHAERLIDGPHSELEGPLYVMREFSRSKPRPEFARFARAYIDAVRSTEDDEADAIRSAFGILLDLEGPAFIEALGEEIEPLPVGHFFREHVEIFVNEAFQLGVRPYGPT